MASTTLFYYEVNELDKPNTKCRVCGKEYFCCSDSRRVGAWKAMACSPDCFKEYMRLIEESRRPKDVVKEKDNVKNTHKSKATEKERKPITIGEVVSD